MTASECHVVSFETFTVYPTVLLWPTTNVAPCPRCSVQTDWPAPARHREKLAPRPEVARPRPPLEPRRSFPRQADDMLYFEPPNPSVEQEQDQVEDTPSTPGLQADDSNFLARTALSQFYHNGIESSDWHIFQVADDFRLAYIGAPVSNLSHLVQLRCSHLRLRQASRPTQHTLVQEALGRAPYVAFSFKDLYQFAASPTDSQGQNIDSPLPLHFPYPQIRPLEARHTGDQAHPGIPRDLSTDALTFLGEKVRESLVKAYFDSIHPSFPAIAPSMILQNDGKLSSTAPPLLVHAVLLAGANVCSHPQVVRARPSIKAALFRTAGMLFHRRSEKDRLHLTQAALLFTWHINDGDTVAGGPWYWIGVALRISCGQGAHRLNPLLPDFERIMYKRSWWCAFVSEAFSALETGRPCAVRPPDTDQSVPTEEELNWDGKQTSVTTAGGQESATAEEQSLGLGPRTVCSQVPYLYHKHLISLAKIAMDISALNAPAESTSITMASLDARLAKWSLGATSGGDFFSISLRLYFHMVVLNLHRNYRRESSDSQSTCSAAAESIITAMDRIIDLDSLGRCHFPVVSAITAAAIQLVHEIRSAIATGAYVVGLNRLGLLQRATKFAKCLAPLWPTAEAVHNVFEGLRREYEDQVAKSLDPTHGTSVPYDEPDWASLFAAADHIPTSEDWFEWTLEDRAPSQ